MKQHANRLALQHMVNAYAQETGRGHIVALDQQSLSQRKISQNKPLLWLSLHPLSVVMVVPLAYVSAVGRHRVADIPWVWQDNRWVQLSPVMVVGLLLEDIVQSSQSTIDASSVIERWVQSRDAINLFLQYRAQHLDDVVAIKQSFVESEQALLLGHSMHPTPKSRQGFMHQDFKTFSPETQGRLQLHFWLIDREYIVEGHADGLSSTQLLQDELKAALPEDQQVNLEAILAQHPTWKLLPLHPWQARYLAGQPMWKTLHQAKKVLSLGELGWLLAPSTSIRTLCGEDAPWMFKPSLSVSITNSVRINQAHECLRGEVSCQLWRSEFGQQINRDYPSLGAINDPAWIALQYQGEIINETICILRDNPFGLHEQVSCMASLCQDHPLQPENRLTHIIKSLTETTQKTTEQVAQLWFERFLSVAVEPMMAIYMRYGMAFEAHQQNTLLELENLWPTHFWLRDNQGFYYIKEYATEIIKLFPTLNGDAHSVGPKSFVDERFIYYFFGNTLFGLINALGATGFIHERALLDQLQQVLLKLHKVYPQSSILETLLHAETLPYKGNLMTRLHELDELVAPLEFQSVYVQITNPLKLNQQQNVVQEMAYA
jgi:siderophore synthetase component